MGSEFPLPSYEIEALESLAQGDSFKAALLFKKAYKLDTYLEHDTVVWPDVATSVIKTGFNPESLSQMSTLLEKTLPENPLFHLRFAKFHMHLRGNEKALYHFQSAIKYSERTNKLNSPPLFFTCVTTFILYLIQIKEYESAELLIEAALKNFPEDPTICNHLITMKLFQFNASEAEILCEKCLPQDKHPYRFFELYIYVLCVSGKFDKVSLTLEKVLNNPIGILAPVQFSLNCLPNLPPEFVTEYHKQWGLGYSELCKKHLRTDPAPTIHKTETLRVGYISSDFYKHPVTDFLISHLKYLDPKKISTYAYYTDKTEDDYTATLKTTFSHWRNIHNAPPELVFKQINEDKIDILIDLAGHTKLNAFKVLCEKPAPLQMTYLGYPCTTGLPEIDYRIVDNYTDPPGYEKYSTEKLIRLPHCFICFSPRESPPPVLENGLRTPSQVVFGSTNGLHKVNPSVISLWAKIYKRCPGARFLVKDRYFKDPSVVKTYTKYFKKCGIPKEAVTFIGFLPDRTAHLEIYNSIDIALDPFPYNGTTTTCEALLMGVPVIALVGDRHSARVSYSILSQLNLDECIAFSQDEYVEKALHLVNHPEQLLELRKTLRNRLLNSPLCDAPGFARAFQEALFKAWNDGV